MQRNKVRSPQISIIIPVRQLSYVLMFENLPAFDEQDFRQFEVIVLPNEHSSYDLHLLKQYSWLTILPTGSVTRPAEKRNIGVKHARGRHIAFIDDDAYPESTWLSNAVRLMKRRSVRAVCGPGMIPADATSWERAFDLVLRSFLGSGNYSYRFAPRSSRFVQDFPSMNFIMHREDFLKLGGFKSDYWPGEDSKLCNDLVKMRHGRILYDPNICVYHHRRPSLRAFLKQHGQYGFHRGAFFAHGDRNSRELGYVVPTLYLIYLTSLSLAALVATLRPNLFVPVVFLSAPFVLYCLLSIIFFIQSFLNSASLNVAIRAIIALVSMHLFYGLEFIRGFKKGRNKDRSIYE